MTDSAAPTLGQLLQRISDKLDETGRAWGAAGFPSKGPIFAAREAAFAELRDWNDEYAARHGS